MARCIITGCWLVIPAENKALWGDVHKLASGEFVFNGVLDDWEADWVEFNDRNPATDKMLVIIGDYFERRGVICLDATAYLNKVAQEYVQKHE